jgi:hypothetical protein
VESAATIVERGALTGRLGGAVGAASAVLLAASLRWAHHWGFLTVTLVAAWAIATLVALGLTVFALRGSGGSRRVAKFGLALALLSVAAVFLAGAAAAAGMSDDLPDCGGG